MAGELDTALATHPLLSSQEALLLLPSIVFSNNSAGGTSCLLPTVATSTAVSALLRSARCGAECGQLDLASVPYTALRYVSLDPAPPPRPAPATYTLPPTLHDIAAFYSGDVASHICQYLLISTNIR